MPRLTSISRHSDTIYDAAAHTCGSIDLPSHHYYPTKRKKSCTDMYTSLNDIYKQSMRDHYDLACLSDYNTGETLTYGQFAERVARIHLLLEQAGIQPGDKIALLGKNNITWVTIFMATITYGAVIVPILSEFNPRDAQHIINHSDATLLFVSDAIWENIDFEALPQLRAAISIEQRGVLDQREGEVFDTLLQNISQAFAERYPRCYNPVDINYTDFPDDHLCIINYTSGTTGFSKGVMLPVRSVRGNVEFGIKSKLHWRGTRSLSFLPLAHAYGCSFDMLAPLAVGTHVTLLGRVPTPRILVDAMAKVKPNLIICVPLILEKIYQRMIVPALTTTTMRWVLAIPFMDRAIYPQIRKKLMDAFGGEFKEVIVGGAPLNAEVEQFLHRIKFPFTVGYGMTECGPLISYTDYTEFQTGSSGHILDNMEVKILSKIPGEPGEICVRGGNVMTGYYKKPDATADILDEDGWLHTGDMGTLGEDGGTIFIRGRYKTMILSSTGQNIYPEEIEGKLNNMPFVAESLIVERNGRLVALVYPDSEQTDKAGITDEQLPAIMQETLKELNNLVAPYERVDKIQLVNDEFEKTPKRSIKRFKYQ